MSWIQLAKTYLAAFCTKNIKELENLYDNEVQLRDWEIHAKGKEDVLSENKKLFDNFRHFVVTCQSLTSLCNNICVEIPVFFSVCTNFLT